MDVPPFKLKSIMFEHLKSSSLMGLCFSDGERWSWQEIVDHADEESRGLCERAMKEKVMSSPLLQREIASQYDSLQSENIGLFGSAQESGYHVMRTLLNPGDHVIVVTPCYQFLKEIPKMCGADVLEFPLQREENFKLNGERLKKAIRPNTKLMVLNYPHNPTGVDLSLREKKEIIDLAEAHGIYVLNDEIYRGLEFNENSRSPSIADLYERGIVITSLSKVFGLPTLRVGWVASQDKTVIKGAAALRSYTSSRNSELSELFAFMVLRGKNELLARNRAIILKNYALLSQFFDRHQQSLSCEPPQAGTMAFPKLLLPIPIDKFVAELHQETSVFILSGSAFDLNDNSFRITFGKKEMAHSLTHLEHFLKIKSKGNI